MASIAKQKLTDAMRLVPLPRGLQTAVALPVWIGGALYCSGYEALASGADNWPGSLWWSAVAVLPWFALFEWSKSRRGRALLTSGWSLALILMMTALASVGLERIADALLGDPSAPLGLTMLRRLPAIGAALLLILWSRTGRTARQSDPVTAADLATLAPSVDWIEAADNYIELHVGGRSVMLRMTMRDAERALAGRGFVRIHRRYLINRNRISSISGSNDLLVRLDGGIELPVGRAFAANLPRAA